MVSYIPSNSATRKIELPTNTKPISFVKTEKDIILIYEIYNVHVDYLLPAHGTRKGGPHSY